MDATVGDTVHVRGVVTRIYTDGVIEIDSNGRLNPVPAAAVVHVEPRALAVGDKVQRHGCSQVGKLLAYAGEWAMVLWHECPMCVRLSDLVRAT